MFNITLKKVGGIRFLRIGRLQFSFCLCRKVPRTFEWEGMCSNELRRDWDAKPMAARSYR